MDESGEQTKKLFLGGLNYATNEEGLTSYFSTWGTLVDCVVMRFPDSRRSRGFGFITYSSAEEAEACYEARPHTVDGTKIDLKKATPKDEKAPPGIKGEVLRKVFIGGLSYTTTDDGLEAYFEQFGEITDCVVMKYKDSDRSRGFGFVTFASVDSVDTVQANRPHTIDGQKVETKRATPREDAGKNEGKSVTKIFVGGLKDDISDDDLTQYFSQFGNVVQVEQMMSKETGRKRGFGFIEFDDYDSVDKALLVTRHEVSGHKVDIRKALGKEQLREAGYGSGGRGGGQDQRRGGGGRWGGAGGQGGRGYGYGGGQGGWGQDPGYGANPWQSNSWSSYGGGASDYKMGGGAWGDQGNSWGASSGGGYMSSGGGWGGGYGGAAAGGMGGGPMRQSMMGGANRPAPYSVGGRQGGYGGGPPAGGAPAAGPRW